MAKQCMTFDHTADVGLEARADTQAELFEALAEGLTDVVCDRSPVASKETRNLIMKAEDTEALAVDFLSGVLAEIQSDMFMVADVHVESITETSLVADLTGEEYDPDRHEIFTEVKAVTYHELKIENDGDSWVGRVVLDL